MPEAVTILKPLCGGEPGLHENLRSFCTQDYPRFEIIFGVRDATDPACSVVARLIEEFPSGAIRLIVDPKLHGSNRKVSNLINMLPHAKHEVLVMADSDAFVGTDYVSKVTAPLNDPAYFAQVTVDAEAGTIVWPDGIDLAPEPLYAQAKAHPLLAA